VRIWVAELSGLDVSKVLKAQKTKTGWAVLADEELTRTQVLEKLRVKGFTCDEADSGFQYLVQGVPLEVLGHNGPRKLDPLLEKEIATAVSCSPSRVARGRNPTNVFVTFPIKVNPFRVFDSQLARLLTERVKVTQCDRCYGFHNSRDCFNKSVCGDCGGPLDLNHKCAGVP